MISNAKRYIVSSLITFVSSFLLVFATEIQSIDLDTFTKSAIVGACFAAVRAGIKALIEFLVPLIMKLTSKK